MSVLNTAPWHYRAWRRLCDELLPGLLGERLPLEGYQVEENGPHRCSIRVSLQGGCETVYEDLPCPDERGLFHVDGSYRVVVPTASSADLQKARISCLDEQMLAYIGERLGETAEELEWDPELLRAFLPLDRWLREFHQQRTSQYLQLTNWLDMHVHMRRVFIYDAEAPFHPNQVGRVCMISIPEGPNLPFVREIAQGAEIRDGRLIIVDERPQGALGQASAAIPFFEHTDANRLLMGANMMRQWLVPLDPDMPQHDNAAFSDYQIRHRGGEAAGGETEEALVQTGCEPDNPYFWAGHNLLTAYITWDGHCFEDGVVISESAARRMACPEPLEPGDKISNRHGTKGVVSQILPDEQMPKMEDGTPVELITTLSGLISRLNFGQIREAVMGRIARAEGAPAIVPAFAAPSSDELRKRLKQAGLPDDGTEQLSLDGEPMAYRSSVGWVYWGCTIHTARNKMAASTGSRPMQDLGEFDYYALRQAGAFENIREYFHTQAGGPEGLALRVAEGALRQSPPPSARFTELARRLAAVGIGAEFQDGHIEFKTARPAEDALELARPVPHPWARHWQLSSVGIIEGAAGFDLLRAANERLARMLADGAPDPLVNQAQERLEKAVEAYADSVVGPEALRFDADVAFSGQAVFAVGPELRYDQVGLPEEMAWTLFGPALARELGDVTAVEKRSEAAIVALDELMARSWVVVYRRPGYYDASIKPFVSFRPLRDPGKVIRLHPFTCGVMDSDFDGDLGSIFLPLTEAAQQEAGERLSLLRHFESNPQWIRSLPWHDALWGLASLSRSDAGQQEIEAILGGEVKRDKNISIVFKHSLLDGLMALIEREGMAAGLDTFDQLIRRGFAVARQAGGSMHPFMGLALKLPQPPDGDDAELWDIYRQEIYAAIDRQVDLDDSDFGPVLLANRSGARGSGKQLIWYLGGHEVGDHGALRDGQGKRVPMARGLVEGKTAEEIFALVRPALEGLFQVNNYRQQGMQEEPGAVTDGFNVLARARRARRPGLIFPRAIGLGELEPLQDVDSRLFVGLGVE